MLRQNSELFVLKVLILSLRYHIHRLGKMLKLFVLYSCLLWWGGVIFLDISINMKTRNKKKSLLNLKYRDGVAITEYMATNYDFPYNKYLHKMWWGEGYAHEIWLG